MGEFCNWTKAEYDAETERERSTRLKSIITERGPREYYFRAIAPEGSEEHKSDNQLIQPEVDHMVLGVLMHEYILEGEKNWVTCDERVGTNKWIDVAMSNLDTWVIKSKDEKLLFGWIDGLMREKDIREALEEESFSEHVILFDFDVYSEHGVTSIPAKASIDKLKLNGGIDDLKTTRAKTRREFERQMELLNYHFSAAFYERARNSIEGFSGFDAPFRHIVVQKHWPHNAYIWEVERTTWMAMGHANVERAFHRLDQCKREHDRILFEGGNALEAWPDNEADPSPIAAPPWVMDRYAELV